LKIDGEKYEKEFIALKEEMNQRQCFIKNIKNELVGTATAWYDTAFRGEGWGRVHWVAIIPDEQGRKLSNSLLLAVLQRIKMLNCQKVYLVTSTKRIGAIHLYTKFGFVPNLDVKENVEAWAEYLVFSQK
jgi:N-acetylglutamate synthase-like GNAT family acetyltransferase